MSRSLFLPAFAILLALQLAGVASAADKQPPNIVLIISDDQTWSDYSFMGHDAIETPALDKLAGQSLAFTRGYVPSSLCRPSLMTMVTGLYPHQHKVSGNDPAKPTPREKMLAHIDRLPTLPKLLAQKGYLSHQSGKWWEGNHKRGGFTHGMTHGDPKRGGRHGDDGLKIGRTGMKPVFDFIESCDDKPFFLWYAPFLPHTPHNPPERLLKKYRKEGRSLHVAKYYAMCEWFDETCGQLLNYLDENGHAEDTLVIYVTDNGWIQRENSGGYAPKSKRSPNDGGVRTPIMLRWPGKIEPRRDDETLVSSIDLAPTILAAAGVEIPDNLPGVNLLQLATGGKLDRDAIFGEIFAHDVADVDNPAESLQYRWVIEGDTKLIVSADGRKELYDLSEDPWESKNLAQDKPDTVKRLEARLDKWWSP